MKGFVMDGNQIEGEKVERKALYVRVLTLKVADVAWNIVILVQYRRIIE